MTEQQLIELQGIQKSIGDAGETFVLNYERSRLANHPRVNDIRIVGRHDVGLGYDILSLRGDTSNEPDLHIEVKTYSGEPHFFLSQGEQAAASKYGMNYAVYLVDVNKLHDPGYAPIIIHDPAKSLLAENGDLNDQWKEMVQQREFRFINDNAKALANDLETSTVLIGCYNSMPHYSWIQKCSAYNVRQGFINGSVVSDDVAQSVRYLLLYDCKAPRTYYMYRIDSCKVVTRTDMLRWKYPNPHASNYLLYHLKEKIPAPALDIMQILRTYNDKVLRTSGTPIYLQGKDLTHYLIGGTPLGYKSSQTRVYTNEGKPWTEASIMKLRALYLTGTDIAALAHTLKRTATEIRTQLTELGLLKSTDI